MPLLLTLSIAISLIAGSAREPERSYAAAGPIGGYLETINEVALAVEPGGRVHALWTGRLNPHFELFAFYASSPDGVTWTPYTVLNYYAAYDPQIAIDSVHNRVHLVYRSNYEGIIHHTVAQGVVSAPHVLESAMVLRPQLAVDSVSGHVHLIWQKGALVKLNANTLTYQLSVRYAIWDGTRWVLQRQAINSRDTWDPHIAVAPGGRKLLAWFQEWTNALGGPTDPGDPVVIRSAAGEQAQPFNLRQPVSPYYPIPEKDNSILLTYAGGDGKFYLASQHTMWPGHSRVYRYVWDGTWSAPLDVAGNLAGWATPWYIGAASTRALVVYVYRTDDGFWVRSESNGVLGAAENLDRWLDSRGYTAPLAFTVDAGGALHMVAARTEATGMYYVRK